MSKTTIKFFEFEMPILQALTDLGGEAEVTQVYEWMQKNKASIFDKYPEILGRYRGGEGDIVWQNKVRWAREYMKRKGQLEFPRHGAWKLTRAGIERLRSFQQTGKDPDAGLETVMELPEEKGEEPEKAFEILEHLHGRPLCVKDIPIVYEPINEQGVILLFTALAERLGFLIVAIRPQFPDAQLAKRGPNGRYGDLKAEFEFNSSSFKTHGHDPVLCDLIICWNHDWPEAPMEVLNLKDVINSLK